MAQGLRPSQFITTFGPGAIVETPHGPHILRSTDDVLERIKSYGIKMEDLAIRDMRLQQGLLEGSGIFKIPDNQNWENFSYPTQKFPTWNLCVKHPNSNVIHRAHEGCPLCIGKDKNESRKNKYAIRFLVACPNGHLDDVNWRFLVHSSNTGEHITPCATDHFWWRGSGASLSAISIQCPTCHRSKELGEIYSARLTCRGRRPEIRGGIQEACTSDQAIVVQRGSFQLRLPEVITSLSIPPLVNYIHRILQRDDLQFLISIVKGMGLNKEQFFLALKQVGDRIPKKIQEELKNIDWQEIENAIKAIDSVSQPKSKLDYLKQEHSALIDVIDTGFPPYPTEGDRRPGEPISFQIEETAIRRDVLGPAGNMKFRVMPIERLRVVIVQVGYRRVKYVGPDSHLSRTRGQDPDNSEKSWLPGVEQFGEGLYIDLNPAYRNQLNWFPEGPSVSEWESEIPETNDPNSLVQWNPLSVWWHSLSHRLINALSLHSGFSSSSIRERIYYSVNESGERRGGILLYTTQPGGDGTMGGLTSLVPQIEQILSLAFANIDRCSNDPLCEHVDVDDVSKVGAACYSCQMVSETSCEHFNGYLNRRILLENLP